MKDEKIIEINGKLFELEQIYITTPDIIIATNDDDIHRNLMEKATFRLGRVTDNVFTYLIDGKIIQVNGKKK